MYLTVIDKVLFGKHSIRSSSKKFLMLFYDFWLRDLESESGEFKFIKS